MADEQKDRLIHLEQDLSDLRQKLARLEAELTAARGRVDLSMRGQLRCPNCGCRKIMRSVSVLDQTDVRRKLAMAQPSVWRSRVVGEFEAFFCTECGLVEWFVKDPDSVEADGKQFQLLDGGSDNGAPFR